MSGINTTTTSRVNRVLNRFSRRGALAYALPKAAPKYDDKVNQATTSKDDYVPTTREICSDTASIIPTSSRHREDYSWNIDEYGARPTLPEQDLTVERFETLCEEYFLEQDSAGHAKATLDTKRVFVRSFLWFMKHRGHTTCGRQELLEFFRYLRHGHEEEGGRFGIKHLTKPPRPTTVHDYHVALTVIFKWMEVRGFIATSPMKDMPKKKLKDVQKDPLSMEELQALFTAAKSSEAPERNTALLILMLDTGGRSAELLGLRTGDLDLKGKRAKVIAKGDDELTIHFSPTTVQYLERYLALDDRLDSDGQPKGDTPLWLSRNGTTALKSSGLRQLLKRLKKKAGLRFSCSPHAFRRTFAVLATRAGWNAFTIQAAMNHSDLEMTRHYTKIAETDIEGAQRRNSPAESTGIFAVDAVVSAQPTEISPPAVCTAPEYPRALPPSDDSATGSTFKLTGDNQQSAFRFLDET